MNLYRILILEDDLETLSILLRRLHEWEEKESQGKSFNIAVTILSEAKEVKEFLNQKSTVDFDVILLDRDTKECESFHILDFDKCDVDKIVSISSVPPHNEDAKAKGVSKVVYKDYSQLEEFADEVLSVLSQMYA